MEKKFEVVCMGAAVVDLPLYPVSKAVFDTESYAVDGIAMTIGGDAINEATIITRLGHRAALVSSVGADIAGDFILEHCRKNGIDISYMQRNPEYVTAINVGLVTADGERTFITNRQSSLWKYNIGDVNRKVLEEGKILSFASIFNNPLFDGRTLEELFAEAREKGMIICADMIMPRLGEKLEDIAGALSYVDYFFPNYEEARLLTGRTDVEEICDVFLSCGTAHVVIKTGKKGCMAKSKSEKWLVPGYPASNCIDTIGAGDNFASGFISGLLEGKSFRDCARFANTVASISVEAVGATGGVKNRRQAEERYSEYLKVCDKQ